MSTTPMGAGHAPSRWHQRSDAASVAGRRLQGSYVVDAWGLDPDIVSLVAPVLSLRFDLDVVGAEFVPTEGPVVLVANQRVGLSEPWVLAQGIGSAVRRPVRIAGIPDVAPVGPALRRLGGVLRHPDEIAALLRAEQVVGLLLSPRPLRRTKAGSVDPALLEAAVQHRAAVVPVALVGHEVGRRWQLHVGPSMEPSAGPVGRASAELAERTTHSIEALLERAHTPANGPSDRS